MPDPQPEAICVAFGIEIGEAADRFLVGLAVLSLLSAVAEERPLVCLVDDAQWLDEVSAQILGFVARRLLAESIALVLAVRDPNDVRVLEGLPERTVGGLINGDARALLASVSLRLDTRVQERIIAETRGNPRYGEAIERLEGSRIVVHLARAHLVFGEWLRRQNRRVDAREQLRLAHDMLHDIGCEAYAERARRELLATGATARERTVTTQVDLTPQEAQIARLAAAGRTNAEIGSELFISPKTVEYHLSKVFTKLGLTTRRDLRKVADQLGT